METVGIEYLARLAGKSQSTISRWAARVEDDSLRHAMHDATKGAPAQVTRPQAAAILRAGKMTELASLVEGGMADAAKVAAPQADLSEFAKALVTGLRHAGVLRAPASAARRRFADEIRKRAAKTSQAEQALYVRAYRELEAATGINLDALKAAEGFTTLLDAADHLGLCERLCAIAQEWGRAELKQGLLSLPGGKGGEP
jgi:hypothetical protein